MTATQPLISSTAPATVITVEHETLSGLKTMYVFDAGPLSREAAADLHWVLIGGRCTRTAAWNVMRRNQFEVEAQRNGQTIIDLRHRS